MKGGEHSLRRIGEGIGGKDGVRLLGKGELKAKLAKEVDRPSEVVDDDSYIVHPFERHVSNLQGAV